MRCGAPDLAGVLSCKQSRANHGKLDRPAWRKAGGRLLSSSRLVGLAADRSWRGDVAIRQSFKESDNVIFLVAG